MCVLCVCLNGMNESMNENSGEIHNVTQQILIVLSLMNRSQKLYVFPESLENIELYEKVQ